VWFAGNTISVERTLTVNQYPTTIFVSITGDIYFNKGHINRIDKWVSNTQSVTESTMVSGTCFGLFVDINDTLYCSVRDHHIVEKISLQGGLNTTTIVAGKRDSPGLASNLLDSPCGIFVHTNFSLYVADCKNNRIQHFQLGQTNGITVAENVKVDNKDLNCPTGITLDGEDYLFIVDSSHHRIVRSGPNGFECLVGCSIVAGSTSDHLYFPKILAFDSDGNMFVTDRNNDRIQKFVLNWNSCSKCHDNDCSEFL
jgi:DNA-binding beta-propeller fold protein YncE